jgi:hypothetical protein
MITSERTQEEFIILMMIISKGDYSTFYEFSSCQIDGDGIFTDV